MTGFYPWLREQRKREGPFGDFARDTQHDRCLCRHSTYYGRWFAHLIAHGACDAVFIALREAWIEYYGTDPEDDANLAELNHELQIFAGRERARVERVRLNYDRR